MSYTTQASAEEFVMNAAGLYFDDYRECFRFTNTGKKAKNDPIAMAVATVEFEICRKYYQQTKTYRDDVSLNEVLGKMSWIEFRAFIDKLNAIADKYSKNQGTGADNYDLTAWKDLTGVTP